MRNVFVVFVCVLNIICAVANVYFFGFWNGLKKDQFDIKTEKFTASK